MPRHRHSTVLAIAALCLLTPVAAAQDLTVSQEKTPAPVELAEPIRALMQGGASVVMLDANRMEVWWVTAIPLDSVPSGAPSWANVPDGALVGAMRVAQAMTDVRGYAVKPGVYTLRFALQPQDGDHMGVSPFRQFLLVAPAADDRTPDPLGFKGAVALAKKTLGKSHPATLSLDPPVADKPAGTLITNDSGHKGIVFTVPLALQGKSVGSLSFGLVLVGVYEH